MRDTLNLLITFFSDHYQNAYSSNRNYIKNITWSPFDRIIFRSVKSLKELCSYNRFSNTSSKMSKNEQNEEFFGISPKLENAQEEEIRWTGVMQCMHLVEEQFDDNETQPYLEWHTRSNTENSRKKKIFEVIKQCDEFDTKGLKVDFDFYCIYAMRFSNEIQNLRVGEQIWDKKAIRESIFIKVRDRISNKIRNSEMDFKCFRSLGSEDMVIIFLANSMNDIVNVGEFISNLEIKFSEQVYKNIYKMSTPKGNTTIRLFSTVCIFPGLNNPSCDKYIDTDLIMHMDLKKGDNAQSVADKVKGEMQETLKCQLKNGLSAISKENQNSLVMGNEDLVEEINYSQSENKSLHDWAIFCGIGTLILHIPAGTISYRVFHKKGIFNGESDFYKENIYNSRTYFCLSKSDNNKKNSNEDKDIFTINMEGLTDEISCLYPIRTDKLKKEGQENNKSKKENNENDNEVARFIFNEYDRLISSQRTIQWHGILSRQREVVKDFAKYYFKADSKFIACDLLNYAQSSLHLINQACSPVSEIPNHNHFYSGSFHDIIKAYYGIIGMIFNIGRNLPHDSKTYQHVVDFAICLNSTARIESKIFTRNDIQDRFVVFFLPYDDFWDFSGNIKLLIHEVFHYIAPYSREIRANYFVKTIYVMLISERIKWLCDDKLKQDHCSMEVANKIEEWKEWLTQNYDKDIKEGLLDNLQKHFPGFFVYSNPEWSILYLDYPADYSYPNHGEKKSPQIRDSIGDIVYVIDNYVKDHIINSLDQAFNKLNEISTPESQYICNTFTFDFINNKIYGQNDFKNAYEYWEKIFKKINATLRRYNLATKEAFCDMWSALISGITIPEYIVFILEIMAKINPQEKIIAAIESRDIRSTRFDIRATVIRILLLIHKCLESTSDNSVKNYEKSLNGLFYEFTKGRKQNDYISRCISGLSKKYGEFIKVAQNEIDALCNVAFFGLDKSFQIISKKNPGGGCKVIRSAAKIDLTSCIGIETIDIFSNYIDNFSKAKYFNAEYNSFHEDYMYGKYNRIEESGRYKMQISSFAELLDSIKEIKNNITQNPNQPRTLWYRGVCSDRFSLLPSIFRKGNPDISIYANQANVIKRAYFSTLYASDIWNLPIEQRMAYLQHYGMPTNLLDFSVDPFTALHFALNPDVASDRENVNNGKFQPVIYVFDPIIYGQAIRKMIECNPALDIPDSISAVEFDINHNHKEKSPFFVDDMSYEFLSEHNNKHLKEYTPNDRGDPFPVPIVIQQSNMRIAAQSGTFVAFSLDALPQRNDSGSKFDYLNLLTIQRRYTQFLGKTTNYDQQFIFPIYLRKNFILSFREELMNLNINTGKFYPELSKIFEDTISQGLNDGI